MGELEAFARRGGLLLGGEGDRVHSQEAAERTLAAAEQAVEDANTDDPTRELRTVTGETVAVRVQDALKLLSERLDKELGALRDAHDVASAVHEKELREMDDKLSKLHTELKFDQHENEAHEIAAKKADEVANAARKAAMACIVQTPKLKEQCVRLGRNVNATRDEKEKLHHAYEMVMKELHAEKRLGEWVLNLIESKLHKLRKDTQIAEAKQDAKEKAAAAGIVAKKLVQLNEGEESMSDSDSDSDSATGMSSTAEEAAEKALNGFSGSSGASGSTGASGGTGPEEIAVGLQAASHFKSAAQEALADAKKAAEKDIDNEAQKLTQGIVEKAPMPSVAEVEKCATVMPPIGARTRPRWPFARSARIFARLTPRHRLMYCDETSNYYAYISSSQLH